MQSGKRISNKQPQAYRLRFWMLNMSILHMYRIMMFMPMVMMMTTMMTTTMMMTTMLMRLLPLTVKILSIEMSLKRGLNKGNLGTLRETLMIMRHWTVVNLMQTMLLVSKTLRTQSLPTHLLPCHFLQILGKIWLILHILRYHLCLLGERG